MPGWVLGVGLSTLLILPGCDAPPVYNQAGEVSSVGVIEATEQKVNPHQEFVGKTRAKESVALRARVTGFLQERDFEEGSEVEAGRVLFEIEPERYQAALAQAEAQLAAAEASLNRAQVDAARYKDLRKSKNVSQQKLDEAEAQVLVEEAAVQTAKAAIQQAQLDVDYTQVKAPIAGKIDLASLDIGNLVGPDSGVLAEIRQMDPIHVTFSISETLYLDLTRAKLQAGRADGDPQEHRFVPRIRLPDGDLYEHPGEFDFIDTKVDEKTGTILVRALFPNPDLLLLPGQFVTLVVEREEARDEVVIPQAAVLTDQGGAYVMAVNAEDKIEVRRIETGQRFGPNLVVSKGLADGDRIVLHGVQKVRPGVRVKPELTRMPTDPAVDAVDGKGNSPETAPNPEADPAGAAAEADSNAGKAESE